MPARHSKTASRRNTAGFTLVELLVVVAIIAILASMLLPALRQAKLKASQAACVAQVSQLATGQLVYLDEFDEWFPKWVEFGHTDGGMFVADRRYWPELILPYTGGQTELFVCPARPEGSWSQQYLGYGYNYYWLGNYWAGSPGSDGTRIGEVGSPDDTIVFGDGQGRPTTAADAQQVGPYGPYIFSYHLVPSTAGPYLPSKCHANGTICGWLDGHVSRMQYADIAHSSGHWDLN